MSLRRVTVTHEAALCMATQALSTERQEVMGLLLGSWTRDPGTGLAVEAEVRHVVALARTDRRKDRVEVGYEQLAAAEERASALTAATGAETRIIGWVHSHPHITVLPSHVDLRTQAQYQQMDPGFLGLIVAVFQDDTKNQLGRMELTAFQSVPPGTNTDPPAIKTIDDDDGDDDEGEDANAAAADDEGFSMLLDKPAAAAASSSSSSSGRAAPKGRGARAGTRRTRARDPVLVDEEVFFAEDDAVAMAIAHDPCAAHGGGGGGGGYEHKGVPIRLVSAAELGGLGVESRGVGPGAGPGAGTTADAARCVVSLQEVLLAEERFFYEAAARANHRNNNSNSMDDGTGGPGGSGSGGLGVHALYNAAVYAKALAALMEESALPLLNSLEALLLNLRRDRQRLAAANARLRARLPPGERGEEGDEEEEEVVVPMETEGPAAGGAAAALAEGAATGRVASLGRAGKGVVMREVNGAGGVGDWLRVSMARQYGGGGGGGEEQAQAQAQQSLCLGTWVLRAVPTEEGAGGGGGGGGGGFEGRLLGIASASQTHGPGAVAFSLAAAAAAAEGQGPPRVVTLVGRESEAAATLWLQGVAPIVCPDIL